jgi:urease accessory protein
MAGYETETAADARSHARSESALELGFERGACGQTVLVRSVQQPPLRVVRAFALPDGSALAHVHNVSGGLLGGDALSLSVDVGPHAQVQLTTTSATRIYRPRAGALPATQRNHIRVAENAVLEYVPDAIIPFAGSRFVQETTIELAAGAGLFWWEIVAPGREARAEVFAYESFEMNLDLLAGRELIAAERVRLVPRERAVDSPARLGPFRYWATLYICRVGVAGAEWLHVEERLRLAAGGFAASASALWGVSTLTAHGLAVRCLAKHGRDAVTGLHLLWHEAKLLLYNREAIRPRKVN